MQSVIAAKLFTDHLIGQGLISRCLVTAPETMHGKRPPQEPNPEDDRVIAAYNAHLLNILRKPMRLKQGRRNELDLPVLKLSAAAVAALMEFEHAINDEQKPEGHYAPIPSFANKMAEHAQRLAAILTLISDVGALEISVESMLCGIELALFYGEEALRILDAEQISKKLLIAQELLDWMQKHWRPQHGDTITFRQISQSAPRSIRSKTLEEREAIVGILKKHGWLATIKGSDGKFKILPGVGE
jgi:Protein of unknown function (DUF3987)